MPVINQPKITGVILAGGKALRMNNADKGFVNYKNKPLIKHVIDKFAPQVDELLIVANRNISQYQQYGYNVISDSLDGFQGPLAGILTALEHASNNNVVVVPCDTPNLPSNLVTQLVQQNNLKPNIASYAHDGIRAHPVITLLNKQHQPKLQLFLNQGNRKLMLWLELIAAKKISFSGNTNAFLNINTPEQLKN